MNMDYMSQFMGPGLGGIMAGTEQRQLEDKRFADTQMTLQQIASNQAQELRAGEEEKRKAALHPVELERKQLDNQKLSDEQKHQTMVRYAERAQAIGELPGAEETLDQEFPQLKNHPIRKALAEARAKDAARGQAFDGALPPGEMTEVQKITQRLAMMDPKSRDAKIQQEHQTKLAEAAQEAARIRAKEHDDRITARQLKLKEMQVERDMAVTEMKARAVATKLPNMGQYMVSLLKEQSDLRANTTMDRETRIEAMADIQRKIDYQYTLMNQGGVERAVAGNVNTGAATGVPTHPTVVTPPVNPSNTATPAAAAPPPNLAKYFTGATKFDPNMEYQEVPDGQGGMKLQARPKK